MDAESDTGSIKGKVLVVDDEESVCESLHLVLENRGYQVVSTQKAEESLEKLKDGAFDVVLADAKMPEMDGIQMFRAIRQIDPRVQVIFMRYYRAIKSAGQDLELDEDEYITKPLQKVEKILIPIERAIAKTRQRIEAKSVNEVRINILL